MGGVGEAAVSGNRAEPWSGRRIVFAWAAARWAGDIGHVVGARGCVPMRTARVGMLGERVESSDAGIGAGSAHSQLNCGNGDGGVGGISAGAAHSQLYCGNGEGGEGGIGAGAAHL